MTDAHKKSVVAKLWGDILGILKVKVPLHLLMAILLFVASSWNSPGSSLQKVQMVQVHVFDKKAKE